MSEILFLAHRIPYPPNKGDKIRSYHLLRHLAKHHDIHLGCFVDDPTDFRYLGKLENICASVRACRLHPVSARIRSIRGFVSGEALSLPYYKDNSLAKWVKETLASKKIEYIIAFCSPMAQYFMGNECTFPRRIIDFVDIDSDKWRQYGKNKRFPMAWIYGREAKRLMQFENDVARVFDASIFVTQNEVELFNSQAPNTVSKHFAVTNGVATDYFDPSLNFSNPYWDGTLPFVFTGAMDYWANVDAVTWYAREVLPKVRAKEPRITMWIVGAFPARSVLELKPIDGIEVTGWVPDVRPYLKYAKVAIAPLRISRGIQNKVLEALAMGCPVLCTPQTALGLSQGSLAPIAVAGSVNEMVQASLRLASGRLDDNAQRRAREYVLDNYSWDRSLKEFERIVIVNNHCETNGHKAVCTVDAEQIS